MPFQITGAPANSIKMSPSSEPSGRKHTRQGKTRPTIGLVNHEDGDSDSDVDSLTEEFDKVGRSVSFSIPDFTNLKLFNFFNTNKIGENSDGPVSEFLLERQLSQIFSKRRDQLTEFINDLASGFSIQNALDRLQALRDVVQNTVELPVTDDEYVDTERETEPHGVVPAVEKQYPIIDELVIPQSDTKKTRRRHRSKSLNKYNYLTDLSGDEFQDENFLRARIKQILSLQGITENHKNKLVQNLMMRSYHEKVKQLSASKELDLNLKFEFEEQNVSSDTDVSSNADHGNEDEDEEDEVTLTTEDLKPSYFPGKEQVLGCQHYQRNCKIECPICNRWYTCRFCHDHDVSSHQLPRPEIKHVLCMFCQTPQLPSQICINEECGKVLSHYYCDKCKLFDNDLAKDIYHCDDCGICRLGQGLNEDFFHCKGCNACISIDLQNHHRCIENSTHSNCSICGDYMFSSIKTVVFMQCGHPIHQSCFDEYTKHSYKCPICSRSIVNMEAQFRVLDQEISLQPLPEPYGAWKCIIQCNDCKAKSMVKYHILGLKCDNCKSYNTSQLKVLKSEQELKDLEERDVDEIDDELQDEIHQMRSFNEDYENNDDNDDDYDENDDENEDNLGNLINNDTLTSFDKYKEWFFSRMDSYLSQVETDNNAEDESDSDVESYEEDDYDDMR